MRAFFAAETDAHAPEFFLKLGKVVPNEERAERSKRLRTALDGLGVAVETPGHYGDEPILAVHSARYLEFLKGIYGEWSSLPAAGPEVVANVQPRHAGTQYPPGIIGRMGWHMGDLACPIGKGTAEAACRAADTAVAAAETVSDGTLAYALCRPPGHHASAEVAGGHCYLNNSAIAAERLRANGARVAILDIDVHHGNGTQSIYYRNGNVTTVSVHAGAGMFYPWFTGHPDERGEGEGEGANHNISVPVGASGAAWQLAVADGLAAAVGSGADALVLALGLDVHESDPLGALKVSTHDIFVAGEIIGRAALPTVVVQEGGYLGPVLTENLTAFLGGLRGSHPSG